MTSTRQTELPLQWEFNFNPPRPRIVKNFWGNVWHVSDQDSFAWRYEEQPASFDSPELALQWLAGFGETTTEIETFAGELRR